MEPERAEITTLLKAWGAGEPSALDRLVPLVYRELKRMARRHMRRGGSGLMQTTALVHDAYLRMVDLTGVEWQDRAHFYAVSARVMRGLLVDAARVRNSKKRGGNVRRNSSVELDQVPDFGATPPEQILTVDAALNALGKVDPRQVRIVEMRFFGGLTVEESAEVLKLSPETIARDWRIAKAWLRREMSREK